MAMMEDMVRLEQSPFAIPREDVDALCADEGFQLLRKCLVHHADFCAFHTASDYEAKQTWILHRDLLHALTMPVVELFKRASALAQKVLCTGKSTRGTADLETAFVGEARSAFLWLQCFLGESWEWGCTMGCPACIITEILSTESHLRLTIAASLLSTASIASPNSSPGASASSSPTQSPIAEAPFRPLVEECSPSQSAAPTLPPLPHILPALRAALASDPFWGPDYWPYLLSKASRLSGGIQSLIQSCIELEALISSSPMTSPTSPSGRNGAPLPKLGLAREGEEEKGVKLSKSKLAKRQLRLKGEEAELLRRCALQCWARAAVPSRIRGEVLGVEREKRGRSLTCP
ncbi:hypothetical protein K458DRAFT_419272 [Lentithecium fluviatile CBS 122367]|uniref:Uncharacterized protein n=1 Tax=Lentithecium fluviatile CBS 122367 TaxID=1168545 RepID=A0A6G1IXQ6_9PLEO|nr:hypothetical protein K458DRAFT_419272 [Lentithecium fluviatile CBS 122367]